MSFDDAWAIAQNIPGWFSEEEARLLYETSKSAKARFPEGVPLNMMEVGCYAGRSTRILAEAAGELSSTLWIIDSFSHERPIPGVEPKYSVLKTLEESKAYFILMQMYVSELPYNSAPAWIDFVHIDDSHKAEDLEIDREKILSRLVQGGIACFHDYLECWPDVIKFVDSLRGPYREIGRAGGLIVMEKK